MTGAGNDVPAVATATGTLVSAVIEAARHAAGGEWGQPPRLYALAERAAIGSLGESLPLRVNSADPDALIPIEQDLLPEGDPDEVLARIRWPADVAGCVLVTEIAIDADKDAAAADRRQGRLTLGVLRGGEYVCCLQLCGDDELIIGADLADDLVTALLSTL
jgi:hypothetical protein